MERLSVACVALLTVVTPAGCDAIAGRNADVREGEAGYHLSLAARTAQVLVGPEAMAPRTPKFVRIEVTQVMNPQRLPLSFTVEYQPVRGAPNMLGMFSLFPPDNPGTFLVPTQGKLRAGGSVIITLVPLEQATHSPELRVQLRRISFVGD